MKDSVSITSNMKPLPEQDDTLMEARGEIMAIKKKVNLHFISCALKGLIITISLSFISACYQKRYISDDSYWIFTFIFIIFLLRSLHRFVFYLAFQDALNEELKLIKKLMVPPEHKEGAEND